MTTNLEHSQANLGQIHPKDDPSINFHHTFEVFLPSNTKQVFIMHDNHIIFKIPTKAFWNSSGCQDNNYYTINTLNMENSATNKEYIVRNPSLKTYSPNSDYFPSYEVIGDIIFRRIDEDVKLKSLGIKGIQIPELAKNYKVQYNKEMQFPFVKANQADDCKVLTVQENEQSSRKFDFPSIACKSDNGKIVCNKFGTPYDIPKPQNSAKYYMTTTKDLNDNYKFYFSDKNGNRINDLTFSLSDTRITEAALLQHLELHHDLKKLQTTAQTIDEHFKNGTDSFEEGTAKTITNHFQNDAPTLEAVATELLKKPAVLGKAVLDADKSDPHREFSHYVKDGVKTDLSNDPAFKAAVKGETGRQGIQGPKGLQGENPTPLQVAQELVTSKKSELGVAVLNVKDIGQKSKLAVELAKDGTLKTDVKDLLKGDIEKDLGNLSTIVTKIQLHESAIQGYETQSQSSEERIKRVEREIVDEESKIAQFAKESKEAADLSQGHARRSETAAIESENHARISLAEANKSKGNAISSEAAASSSEKHADRSRIAADLSEGHATRSETAANKSEDHRDDARLSSDSAAAFEDNVKEMACAMKPQPKGCSPRSRREAIWEELEDSEDQIFQHENSEFAFQASDHNDFSFV